MEFSAFFNELNIDKIWSWNAEKMLLEYKRVCQENEDFIQLYELKNILSVINIFSEICNAYQNCHRNEFKVLFDKIEYVSDLLEESSISCLSYSYYLYVIVTYLYEYDCKVGNDKSKGLSGLEKPELMKWVTPLKFDYSKLKDNTTFGVKDSGYTKAFPNFNNFICERSTLISYKGNKSYVIIPDTISKISNKAFSGNKKIKMVIIPNSVREIEDGAFSNCEGLNLVQISNKISKIPNYCFSNCKNLKCVFGDSIKEIGDSAFEYCVQLENIDFNSLETVGKKAFFACVGIKDFDFVSNLSVIDDYAFAGVKIKNLFLNYCEYLGSGAFSSCKELSDLVVNNNIENIGEKPFYNCQNIISIDMRCAISFRILDFFASSGDEYDNCNYRLEYLKLATLSPYVCSELSTIKYVEVSGNTIISNNAFQNCSSLERVEFNEKDIRLIDDYAFDNCCSLKELDINYLGKSIGVNSFYGCSQLDNYGFLDNVVEYKDKCLAHTNLTSFNFMNKKFEYVGSFAFANAYYPENFNICFEGSILSAGIFHGAEKINCLKIKNCNLDKNYLYALFERTKEDFANKVRITSLITDYNACPNLFEGFNSSFIECKIDDNAVPDNLFRGCSNLESVKLDGTINYFGESCFMDCNSLEYIDCEISEDICVSNNAFMNCKKYDYPYFDKTNIIGDYAFYGSKIEQLALKNNIKYIGNNAFGNCNIVSNVILPFAGNEPNCNQPFGVIFSSNMVDNAEVQLVEENKYYIPNSIDSVVINERAISDCAFMNCYFLKKIELPNVEGLTSPIFQNCSKLEELIVGDRLKEFNAVCLLGANKDLHISIKNNNHFISIDNSVYSKDKTALYYLYGNCIIDDAKIIKSYSMMNYNNDELCLKYIDLLETNAINLENVKNLILENVDIIKREAFINCDSLKDIAIKCDSNNEYRNILKADSVTLDKLSIDNISMKKILDLFEGIDSIRIKNLYLENFELEDSTFDGAFVDNLYLNNCKGSAFVRDNIANITMKKCDSFNEMFVGNNNYDTISISKPYILEEDITGLNCNNLVLENISILKSNALKNVTSNNLTINGVDTIENGSFFDCKINQIDIYNSKYTCVDNCIYINDQLIYYKPNNKHAMIPSDVKFIYKHSVDLTNAISFEINKDVVVDNQSIFNALNIEKITCGRCNLDKLIDLFEGTLNVKEVVYYDDIITRKYLSNISSVERIVLNKTINRIGDQAFSNDANLKAIVNFDRAKFYGDFVLSGCSSISEVALNREADVIGYHIVEECGNLKSIVMPLLDYYENHNIKIDDILGDGVPKIHINITSGNVPNNMFYDSSNSISFDYSPEIISDNAFVRAKELNIDLSNTNYIGDNAFLCSSLQYALNLKKCKYIGEGAFLNCDGVREIELFDSISNIGDNAFKGTSLSSLTITNNSKYRVEEGCLFADNNLVFYPPYCKKESIKLDCFIDTIKSSAFSNCVNLVNAYFENVKVIENNAFSNCDRLKVVDIHNSLSSIDGVIFDNCNISSLSLYKIKQGSNTKLADYFSNNTLESLKYLCIYSSTLDVGELDCDNSISRIVLSDNISEIPNGYFNKCIALSDINIPSNCISIGDDAFNGCKELENVDLSKSKITKYGKKAFANTIIKELNFNNYTETIGEKILENTPITKISFDTKLNDFDCDRYGIGYSLQKISFSNVSFSDRAFSNMRNLKTINVEKYNGEVIPYECFNNCVFLKDFNISYDYKTIRTRAFNNCSSLVSIYVPSYVNVEEKAFENCNGIEEFVYDYENDSFTLGYFGFNAEKSMLKEVVISNSILADSAFKDFKNIEHIGIKKEQKIVPYNCFMNCNKLEKVDISGFFAIEESSFENCNSLEYIDFCNCKRIEENAFKNCTALKMIKIPKSVEYLSNAFSGCTGITTIAFDNTISCFSLSDYGFDKSSNIENISFDIVSLSSSAFSNFEKIKHISFNEEIKTIPLKCFENCKNISFDNNFFINLETIGEKAFYGCESINSVILNKVKTISNYAFEKCSNLSFAEFGKGIKEIPEGLFLDCNKLKDVVLKDGIEKINKLAFSGTKIRTIDIYDSIKYIGSMIFENNTDSVDVIAPSKKIDTSKWAIDWNLGLLVKHKIFSFLNPKVKIKAR